MGQFSIEAVICRIPVCTAGGRAAVTIAYARGGKSGTAKVLTALPAPQFEIANDRDAGRHINRNGPHQTQWTIPSQVSSGGSDFNFDYRVSFTPEEMARKEGNYYYNQHPDHSEMHGISIFYKDPAGKVFHTYSSYARGIDSLNAACQYLDLVPEGRDEGDRGPSWVCRHDEYADNATTHKGCREQR